MNLWESCLWTLLRSGVVAAVALSIAMPLSRLVSDAANRTLRRLVWVALLIPFVTPSILVGYAYAHFSSLIRHEHLNHLLYVTLLCLKFVPVAVLVLHFAPPPPIGAQAMHVAKMMNQKKPRLWFRGIARTRAVAFGVVFLIAFQEFEIASLMQVRPKMWAEPLFDLQQLRPTLGESIRHALLPVLCQLIVLAPLLWVLLRDSRHRQNDGPAARALNGSGSIMAAVYLLIAAIVGCAFPAWVVISHAGTGMANWSGIMGEVTASALFAGAAMALVYIRCTFFVHTAPGRFRRFTTIALCIPGLFGSLIVALTMLTLFQRVPGLHALYDTPLPLLIALSLLLLPVGALLVTLILAPRRNNRGQALFLAKSLQQSHDNTIKRSGRSIGWQMLGAPRVWVLFVIFVMGYFDLSSTSLLHPTNMTPAPVLLYNRMHYGQNSVLSAQVLITVAVPVAVMIALWASMQARSLTTRIAR